MLIAKLQKTFSGQFIRNAGWLGLAELANRIFRLGTTVTLARMFGPKDYGLMAIVYIVIEFSALFTLDRGTIAKIVQADEEDLETICNTSYWLNWMLCVSVFLVQCLAAFPIAYFYGNPNLILPICSVGLVYFIFPIFLVQGALIERENRLKIKAIGNAGQSLLGNLITVTLAILGMGVWSIVWAMVISNVVWIFVYYKNSSWRPPKSFNLDKWQDITNFGKNVIAVEFLNRLRMNLDYLIVGRFLGIDELGIYYFAFNAGSGITMNIVQTLISPLFPHLCAVRKSYQQFKKRYVSSVKTIASVIVPIVLLQSAAAPFYVPIIFGENWSSTVPILVLICLSVIPRAFKLSSSLVLNAIDKTHIVFYFDVIYTVVFTAALLVTVKMGVLWVAIAVLASHLIMSVIFNVWVEKYVFHKNKKLFYES
ncbi:MAG: lipopolysaccharide biosynthesis protein [Calothrix sp. MO_167.B12]|nr:lipopolysaccharide biosynthesis protein [Calothrix sp. MO_167.B12]